MTTVAIKTIFDEFSRDYGLVIAGMPANSDHNVICPRGDGTIIAHDILEHIVEPATTLTEYGETYAAGAAWYTRGSLGAFNRNSYTSAEHTLLYELVRLMVHTYYADDLTAPYDHRRIKGVRLSGDFGEVLREMIPELLRVARKDIEYDISQPQLELACKQTLQRAMVGYRAAQKRYPNVYQVNNLFWLIADLVKPYTINPPQIDSKMTLHYCIRRARAHISVKEIDYEIH